MSIPTELLWQHELLLNVVPNAMLLLVIEK